MLPWLTSATTKKNSAAILATNSGLFNWHSPSEVLKECSLRPEDIDTVFVTHAHFDHFGNVDDFPKAKFYIQEREIAKWVWAMSLPERMQWMMVGIDPGDVLRGVELAKNKRLLTVSGDLVDVLPGIDLHPAYDSHTFGSMWVEVRNDGKSTSQDTWVLAGDLIYVYENLSGSGDVVGVEKTYNPVGRAVGSQMNLILGSVAMMSDTKYEERKVIPVHEERLKEVFPSRITKDGLRISEICLADDEPSLVH